MSESKSLRRGTFLALERLEDRLTPDATSFVKSLYVNLLNRTADSGGLAHFVQELQNGESNQQVATEIWRSPEHRGVQVDAFYQTYLHRNSDTDGRAHWVNELLSGAENELQLSANFLTSSEFIAAHNTPAAFVSGLYLDVLGRTAGPLEQALWQNVLQTSGAAAVTVGIVTSAEAYTDNITADYQKYLGRTPDASGLDNFLSGLQTGQQSFESVAEGILGSAEYASKH